MKPLYSLQDEALFSEFDGFKDFRTMFDYGDQQDYKWTAIIYPDCNSYANGRSAEDILSIVRGFGWQEWYYILHDKDIKADGTPKKPHYHIVIKTAPTKLSTVARQLGIPMNYVQRVKSWKKMLQYLIHDEVDDKAKYLVENVVCSDEKQYLRCFDTNSEDEEAQKILQYIVESGCQSYVQLLSWCCTNGLYSCLRRNAFFWSNIIREYQKWGNKEY